jgi:hypothetical protein
MDSNNKLPVLIANVQELDALCRAWLGYDSAVVERLEAELDRLRAIEGAARAYAAVEYVGRIYESPSEWKAVVDALAAYDATKGE